MVTRKDVLNILVGGKKKIHVIVFVKKTIVAYWSL